MLYYVHDYVVKMSGVRPDWYNAKNAFPIITIPALSSSLFLSFIPFLLVFLYSVHTLLPYFLLLIQQHNAVFYHGCSIL